MDPPILAIQLAIRSMECVVPLVSFFRSSFRTAYAERLAGSSTSSQRGCCWSEIDAPPLPAALVCRGTRDVVRGARPRRPAARLCAFRQSACSGQAAHPRRGTPKRIFLFMDPPILAIQLAIRSMECVVPPVSFFRSSFRTAYAERLAGGSTSSQRGCCWSEIDAPPLPAAVRSRHPSFLSRRRRPSSACMRLRSRSASNSRGVYQLLPHITRPCSIFL